MYCRASAMGLDRLNLLLRVGLIQLPRRRESNLIQNCRRFRPLTGCLSACVDNILWTNCLPKSHRYETLCQWFEEGSPNRLLWPGFCLNADRVR